MRLTNYFRQAEYLCAAHHLSQSPEDQGREVAFAGRSNAGKSSAINVITDQNRLARTSKTPGRTRQIVYFTLDETHRLVDLPGYGYAKVSKEIKDHWDSVLEQYLQTRRSLVGLILLMDIRHPFKDYDRMVLHWCQEAQMPVHILLTKADKFSFGKASSILCQAQATLRREFIATTSVQLFSALKRSGVDAAQQHLATWLDVLDVPLTKTTNPNESQT